MNDWEQRYQKGETGWDRGDVSPAMKHWLFHDLQIPARVLIPGCGHGHEVVELARLGYAVTGIDIAPSATDHIQYELAIEGLRAEVILGDMFDYQPDDPFDFVYEQTCLCAIQREQREAYEEKLYGWLKPGGKLLAQFMQTGVEGGPPFHCAVPDMRELFLESRWSWSDVVLEEVPHHNGRYEIAYALTRL